MRLDPLAMPIAILLALFGTVLTAQALGQWSTSGRVAIDPTTMTPADIKGWMTLQDAMKGLNISQVNLYAAGNIPMQVPPSTALNKLESLVPGFSVTALRDALTADSPAAAVSPSAVQATPGVASTFAPVVTSTPVVKGTNTDGGTGPTPLAEGQVLAADQIKGKMTLQDISTQCGVEMYALWQKLNLPPDTAPETTIKDLIAQGKIAEVTDVQKAVAELQGDR